MNKTEKNFDKKYISVGHMTEMKTYIDYAAPRTWSTKKKGFRASEKTIEIERKTFTKGKKSERDVAERAELKPFFETQKMIAELEKNPLYTEPGYRVRKIIVGPVNYDDMYMGKGPDFSFIFDGLQDGYKGIQDVREIFDLLKHSDKMRKMINEMASTGKKYKISTRVRANLVIWGSSPDDPDLQQIHMKYGRWISNIARIDSRYFRRMQTEIISPLKSCNAMFTSSKFRDSIWEQLKEEMVQSVEKLDFGEKSGKTALLTFDALFVKFTEIPMKDGHVMDSVEGYFPLRYDVKHTGVANPDNSRRACFNLDTFQICEKPKMIDKNILGDDDVKVSYDNPEMEEYDPLRLHSVSIVELQNMKKQRVMSLECLCVLWALIHAFDPEAVYKKKQAQARHIRDADKKSSSEKSKRGRPPSWFSDDPMEVYLQLYKEYLDSDPDDPKALHLGDISLESIVFPDLHDLFEQLEELNPTCSFSCIRVPCLFEHGKQINDFIPIDGCMEILSPHFATREHQVIIGVFQKIDKDPQDTRNHWEIAEEALAAGKYEQHCAAITDYKAFLRCKREHEPYVCQRCAQLFPSQK